MPTILVTGGAGYVGSHTVIELLNRDYDVVVIDNMVNSVAEENGKPGSLLRIETLTGKSVEFYNIDLLNENQLDQIFISKGPFEYVIHFAALKAVGESCKIPLTYYSNNVSGSINLLQVMSKNGCKKIVFSSSCTVYGDPQYLPVTENHPTGTCTNPYGRTKFMMEEIMRDVCHADSEWKAIMLRYFNPVGAHPSGEIGEDPSGTPNLMPYISQIAVGKRSCLHIHGNDYPTPDGTGVRDYVHVMDIAEGHVVAGDRIADPSFSGWKAYNLGTGQGTSVLEILQAYQKVSGRKISYEMGPRRSGDVAETFADCSLAEKELNWKSKRSLEEMCADAWNWQSKNPTGFQKT